MALNILVMGLSGAGKTTYADQFAEYLNDLGYTTSRVNADKVREQTRNTDFSSTGRMLQVRILKELSSLSTADICITDFIAPTDTIREIFNADITIWMNTVTSSKFKDTDALFEPPDLSDYIIEDYNYDFSAIEITV